jgi:hypothetical protein
VPVVFATTSGTLANRSGSSASCAISTAAENPAPSSAASQARPSGSSSAAKKPSGTNIMMFAVNSSAA